VDQNVDQTRPARGRRRTASRTSPRQGRPPPATPTSEPRPATALLGKPWRGLGQGHPPVFAARPELQPRRGLGPRDRRTL
jgi:hypothetical protein